jgi:cation transport ATPase
MAVEGIAVPASASALEQAIHQRGHPLVLVALDGVAAGVIELAASLRPDLSAVIKGLRQRGIRHIGIVSGDHTEPTQRLAAEIGADAWHAEVRPEQTPSRKRIAS